MSGILRVCAVKDTAAAAFNNPVFVPATSVALRSFQHEVGRADSQNPLYNHPDDFELYLLGSYDPDTGRIDPEPEPVLIARAKDLR